MDSAAQGPETLAIWVGLVVVATVGTTIGCRRSDADTAAAASSKPKPAQMQSSDVRVSGTGRLQSHSVGQTAKSADYAITVRNVKECPVEPHVKPKRGNVKLGVEVSFEGTTQREVPVNPFYATISDSKGNNYNCTFGGCEPQLQSSRIRSGDRAQGWITFELPTQATGLTLQYSPFVIGTGKQPVRFDLGR